MIIGPNLDDVEVARALITLLPEPLRSEPEKILRCDGGYGSAIITLGDLAALGKKIPGDLVDQVKKVWPDEGQGLDDVLYERLAAVTPEDHVAAEPVGTARPPAH